MIDIIIPIQIIYSYCFKILMVMKKWNITCEEKDILFNGEMITSS